MKLGETESVWTLDLIQYDRDSMDNELKCGVTFQFTQSGSSPGQRDLYVYMGSFSTGRGTYDGHRTKHDHSARVTFV